MELKRMLWSLVMIVVTSYVAICVILYVFQASFIYHPFSNIAAKPDIYNLPYEDVSFKTEDGFTLSAWFVPAADSQAVIMICHGNAGNISHRLDTIHLFYKMGLSTFIFDYRGYGLSQGKPTEQGTYLDAEAAWRYLVKNRGVRPEEIILFGRSLGGAVAANLAHTRNPRAIIVESSFVSVGDMGADIYPFLPVRMLTRFGYSTAKHLKEVSCPVLVSHSKNDEIVPFKHGQKLFAAANDPKEFLEFGGSHNEGFISSGDAYRKGLWEFIQRVIPVKSEEQQ